MKEKSFKNYVIVSCGTLYPELNYLRKNNFLDAMEIFYTRPGRHEVPLELESQLIDKINLAKKISENIIVVYGGRYCYTNVKEPDKSIDDIIKKQGKNISRINADYCVDMLVSKAERDKITDTIAKGEKILWLTPGWIIYREDVFQGCDRVRANESFPKHKGGAVLLDGIGFWEEYVREYPEKILELSDWMGIEIRPYEISLERFKNLLLEKVK